MNLRKQKELICRKLKVSKKRIKLIFNTPEEKKKIKELISKDGVAELLEQKLFKKLPKKGNSKTNAKYLAAQKKKGRRVGHGSRKGTANARFKNKDKWKIKIRALRKLLKDFSNQDKFGSNVYRELYKKTKGNFFRNKDHLKSYIYQNNLVNKKEVNKK